MLFKKCAVLCWVKVVFTSDNGAALVSRQNAGSNGPLLCGKQTTFEGGFRTPTIARWPGSVPAGSVSRQAATQMDLFATFLDLAGVELPTDRHLDSVSLRGVLFNSTDEHDRAVFFYRFLVTVVINSDFVEL